MLNRYQLFFASPNKTLTEFKKFKFRDVVGAEMQHKAGALWPYRLVTGIFEQLLKDHSHRFSIETSTPVTSISYSSALSQAEYPYTLSTPTGSIRAGKVLHCTNAHSSHLLPSLRGKLFPLRGTMSAQSQGKFPSLGSSNSFSYMDKGTLDPDTNVWSWTLYYITQDPNTGDMYIGGEKQILDQLLVSDDTVIGEIPSEALSKVLPEIFSEGWEEPQVVKSMWSGIMAFTADGLPLVGRLTGSMTGRNGDGEWFAGGYNGHGMDKAWLSGEALVGMVLGKELPGFPQAYCISEERLMRMDLENVLQLFGSAGK
jgi:glycine/D-amino acid oxidase-like deaminating enzyme